MYGTVWLCLGRECVGQFGVCLWGMSVCFVWDSFVWVCVVSVYCVSESLLWVFGK